MCVKLCDFSCLADAGPFPVRLFGPSYRHPADTSYILSHRKSCAAVFHGASRFNPARSVGGRGEGGGRGTAPRWEEGGALRRITTFLGDVDGFNHKHAHKNFIIINLFLCVLSNTQDGR